MSRSTAWLLVLNAALCVLVVQRYLALCDAWERQAHATEVQERLGAA